LKAKKAKDFEIFRLRLTEVIACPAAFRIIGITEHEVAKAQYK